MNEQALAGQSIDLPVDEPEQAILTLLAAFNAGRQDAFAPLLESLSARFEALMATVLHASFHRLSEGDSPIGTQTLAQEVRLRIHKGITRGSIDKLNDVEHLMRIAARNARWVLLDRVGELERAKRGSGHADFAQRYLLLLQKYKDQLSQDQFVPFQEAVQNHVEQMPQRLKDVFDLRFYLSNRAAAEHLGLSPTTALGRWNMAVDWLDQQLQAQFPPPGSQ